jgi:CheY-like chemotaxis protein
MIAETTTRPYHVLLVEDDLADVLLVEEALSEMEVAPSLERVGDGVEALAYLEDESRTRPDLIVLDLNMPRMGGAELLSRLKADDRTRAIPVVVLTTSGAPQDINAAYHDYASAYVIKPVALEDFTAAVRSIDVFYRQTSARLPAP